MKKTKILMPLVVTSTLATVVTPIMTLTSCGCANNGNLMREYTPSIKQKDGKKYLDQKTAVKEYLTDVNNKHDIFEQDLLYTLSRGFPQYESWVSEHCEVKSCNFDAKINLISVDLDKLQVVFDLEVIEKYDFGGTKKEELQWYDMKYQKANIKAKMRFTFDFNTFSEEFVSDKFNPVLVQRRQMTTYAGATQFGISELFSTVKMISEQGSYVDLDGKKIEVSEGEGAEHHFIKPQEDYWLSIDPTGAEYLKRYADISNVWYKAPAAQIMVLILKYYMFGNTWDVQETPATFGFGSYYMAKANLKNMFTTAVSHDETNNIDLSTLYGFNYSLDSINNTKNLQDSTYFKNGVFSIPNTLPEVQPQTTNVLNYIYSGAFDGSLSSYSNLGLPSIVKTLEIPGGYQIEDTTSGTPEYVNQLHIQGAAFAENYGVETIKFAKPEHTDASKAFPIIEANAFIYMNSLYTIDFSSYPTNTPTMLSSDNTRFKNTFNFVHVGAEKPATGPEGEFVYPKGATKNDWENFATRMGLTIYDETHPEKNGWKMVESKQ